MPEIILSEIQTIADMRRVFDILDINHNGYLTKDEFFALVEKTGEPETRPDMDYMFDYIDQNYGDRNGNINFDEFVKYMILILSNPGEFQ